MNKNQDFNPINGSNYTGQGDYQTSVPYVGRQDLIDQKRRRDRDLEVERTSQLQQQRFGNPSSALSNVGSVGMNLANLSPEKHVTINDKAQISTYDINGNSAGYTPMNENPYQQQMQPSDAQMMPEQFSDAGSNQYAKQFQTPQVQPSKSANLLKSFNQRTGVKSSMDYFQTPQPNRNAFTLKPSSILNPLVGESEGEIKRRLIKDEYRDFAKRSLERSRDQESLTRKHSQYQLKRVEAYSKSPKQEPNIYATKQRYKYSYFNQVGYGSQERGRSSHQNQVADRQSQESPYRMNDYDMNELNTGYILKTDPIRLLYDKEVQKQQYGRELKEQMQENQQKKVTEKQKKQAYDMKLEADIRNYNQFGRQGGGAPLLNEQGQVNAVRAGYFSDHPQSMQSAVMTYPQNQNQQQSTNQFDKVSLNNYQHSYQGGGSSPGQHQQYPPRDGVGNNSMLDGYESHQRQRDRQREEWKESLKNQMQERERSKHEQQMKRRWEEEKDEERLRRQLQEMGQEYVGSIKSRGSMRRRTSPNTYSMRKREPDLISEKSNYLGVPGPKSNIDIRNEAGNVSFDLQSRAQLGNDSYDQYQKFRNGEAREQIDGLMEMSLRGLRAEALQTYRDTNQALSRLNNLQQEIYMKQKQGELSNHEFYNDIINHSRVMMASVKYKNPYEQLLSESSRIYTQPSQSRVTLHQGSLKGVESDFLRMNPSRYEPTVEPNYQIKVSEPPKDQSESITADIDEILHRFQYQ